MLQTVNWATDGRDCTDILATSYNDLLFVLKFCFMYFGAFLEDHEIFAPRLLKLLVAEGFIPADELRTFDDTAESFLEELVQRSLVQVLERDLSNDSVIVCCIHDLLRELAIQKARRLAVHYSGCNELMEHANPNLRSFLCFEGQMPNCSRQRLLKVLCHMGGRNDSVDCKSLHGLNQLRYCRIRETLSSNIRSFESFIGGLKFVETIDFGGLTNHGDLPDEIWNVKTLRQVILNGDDYTSGPSSSTNLKNLQTLVCVKSRESWNAQLPKLPNVRNLDINVESSFSWDLMAKLLDTLNHLTNLVLRGNEVPQTIVEMERFPFYQQLQSLILIELSSPPNNKLSPVVGMFPIHVTQLTLWNLHFKEDPLSVLEKLCSLRWLYLLGEEVNRKMNCSAGGFPQLHELTFENLTNLEEWEIKEGAMPILMGLYLENCKKLRVPLGLQYLSNLKELIVLDCSELQNHEDEIRTNICKHVPHINIE